MAAELRNVAFKVTWVYGEDGPWSSPCTPEGRQINIVQEGKVWCRHPDCRCSGLRDSEERLPKDATPCIDCRAPLDFRTDSGTYHSGPYTGEPKPMKQTAVGKWAFLTSRDYRMAEEDRILLACFRIDHFGEYPGYNPYTVWADADSPYSLRVPLDKLDQAPRFWNHRREGEAAVWGSGLFRYITDAEAETMRDAIAAVCNDIDTVVWQDVESQRLEDEYVEGQRTTRLVSYYERNPSLRSKAIDIHGFRCQVCDLAFEERYGELGEGFIEVHHLKPLADYEGEVTVDPRDDMAVVCSNCHRMLHRGPKGPLTVEELRRLLLQTE